jgi:LDH2 family malate/lactate/ureidoglycolate dehydrogenase
MLVQPSARGRLRIALRNAASAWGALPTRTCPPSSPQVPSRTRWTLFSIAQFDTVLPVILDCATTAIAGGKIMVAHDKGERLPPGTMVDQHGRPTTDPAQFVDGGAMLPVGGHKGYALAVLVELLGQALTGADATGGEGYGGVSFARSRALVVALDTGIFRPAAETAAVAARIAGRIRSVPPAPEFERVQLPGEPEARSRAEREAAGIPLPRKTLEAIAEAAAGLGIRPVELPDPAPRSSGLGVMFP